MFMEIQSNNGELFNIVHGCSIWRLIHPVIVKVRHACMMSVHSFLVGLVMGFIVSVNCSCSPFHMVTLNVHEELGCTLTKRINYAVDLLE